jgi:hypothetical protein
MTIDGKVIWSIADTVMRSQCRPDACLPHRWFNLTSHPHRLPPAHMHFTTPTSASHRHALTSPTPRHLTFPSSRCPPLVPSKSNTRQQCTTGAFTLIGAQEGAENGCPQRAAFVAEKIANRSRQSPQRVLVRPRSVICWQIAGKRPSEALWAHIRPGGGPGLSCWFGVEPPAGIEPATPSLPCIPGPPPCDPAFSLVVADRRWCSYVVNSPAK